MADFEQLRCDIQNYLKSVSAQAALGLPASALARDVPPAPGSGLAPARRSSAWRVKCKSPPTANLMEVVAGDAKCR